jgi:hypothetical protein
MKVMRGRFGDKGLGGMFGERAHYSRCLRTSEELFLEAIFYFD